MNLIKWNYFDDMMPPLPSLLDEFFGRNAGGRGVTGLTVPAVNIREDADKYAVSLAIPGLSKDDCKITVENGMLTISAEKKNETKDAKENYARYEYNFSSFSRSFALPRNADHEQIKASYTNGELFIELPKKQEVLSGSREIVIQ